MAPKATQPLRSYLKSQLTEKVVGPGGKQPQMETMPTGKERPGRELGLQETAPWFGGLSARLATLAVFTQVNRVTSEVAVKGGRLGPLLLSSKGFENIKYWACDN